MNAYELADAIQDWDSDGQWDTPAADMLRQQADRITDLEKTNEEMAELCEQQLSKKADRIAELEKYVGFKDSGYDILIAHPQTKPLSHDEIWAYAHIHKIKGDVVKFVRLIEAKIRGEE